MSALTQLRPRNQAFGNWQATTATKLWISIAIQRSNVFEEIINQWIQSGILNLFYVSKVTK